MEIRRDTAGYNLLTDPAPASPSRGVIETAPSRLLTHQTVHDRRHRPDRRRSRQPFAGQDRRKKPERRQPKLLNARRPKPEPLEDRRGQLIDVSV